MELFKKTIALLLLMALALTMLPAAGLGEKEEEESKSAFETLRALMETQFSPDIPIKEGEVFTNIVIDDDVIAQRVAENPKKNKASSYNKTPDGILCQILFENRQSSKKKDVKDKSGNPVQEFKIINSAINDNYEYEAVRYNNLTTEQMLYYAYIITSNYSTIQDKLPAGETFSIVVKSGDNLLLINDTETARVFADHIADAVAKLAEGGATAE